MLKIVIPIFLSGMFLMGCAKKDSVDKKLTEHDGIYEITSMHQNDENCDELGESVELNDFIDHFLVYNYRLDSGQSYRVRARSCNDVLSCQENYIALIEDSRLPITGGHYTNTFSNGDDESGFYDGRSTRAIINDVVGQDKCKGISTLAELDFSGQDQMVLVETQTNLGTLDVKQDGYCDSADQDEIVRIYQQGNHQCSEMTTYKATLVSELPILE